MSDLVGCIDVLHAADVAGVASFAHSRISQ
jgi:hypothetical protein